MGRFAIAAYLNVPVYAAFHEWLGRGEVLGEMWRLWKEGDRKAALAAIPDQVVDDLIVWGPPEKCREHIQRYVDNGVTTPAAGAAPLRHRHPAGHPRPRAPLTQRSAACAGRPTCAAIQSFSGCERRQPATTFVLGRGRVQPGLGAVGPDPDDAVLAEEVDARVVGGEALRRRS